MTESSSPSGKSTWRGHLFAHLFAWFFCLGFPALVTAIAPVSWIKFEREGNRVAARAKVCLLFFIPYRTLTVDSVTEIGDRTVAGSTRMERRSSTGRKDREVHTEAQGFLVIRGVDKSVEVPVTPHDIDSVVERSEEFLKDAAATELRMFAPANWKFSVIGGGLITLLLTGTYVGGVVATIVVGVLRLFGIGQKSTAKEATKFKGLP